MCQFRTTAIKGCIGCNFCGWYKEFYLGDQPEIKQCLSCSSKLDLVCLLPKKTIFETLTQEEYDQLPDPIEKVREALKKVKESVLEFKYPTIKHSNRRYK